MTLNEIEKLFDEKFKDGVPPMIIKDNKHYHPEIKQFWLEHFRSLLEEMRKPDKTKQHSPCPCEDCSWVNGYGSRNAEINKHLDNLLSKGEIK